MTVSRPLMRLRKPSLFEDCPVTAAVSALAMAGVEQRGAIFTRREVVEFILDLVGYRADRALTKLRLLEPAFGEGDFLIPAIDRLLEAWRRTGGEEPFRKLSDCIRAVELHRDTFEATRRKVLSHLTGSGINKHDAEALCDQWLIFGDFLLIDFDGPFDAVIGNPPYVRQELIADALMAEYRHRYRTIYDRADLYIPFIERSLQTLAPTGQLGFICADRWMKNKYGGPLRELVADQYRLKIFVDMVDTPAFHTEVMAYPAIVVISNERGGSTRIARRPSIDPATLSLLGKDLLSSKMPSAKSGVTELADVASGPQPWLFDASGDLQLVRRLEKKFPLLEDAGCKVGIGVATGADKAFIGPFDSLDVEESRKLPLVMTRDILNGTVEWRGFGVINPFGPDGKLVDLAEFPRLARYLEERRSDIAGRHVAQKAPANWYRTIDRIYPELAAKSKLLIPDIKGEAHIVLENQGLYPHHNLYFITSDEWDLQALQAILCSGIARLFVSTYSTKMRGGYFRFQAQYLRRIRIPQWSQIPLALRKRLSAAAKRGDAAACNEAIFELYDLNDDERAMLGGSGI